jgi:hypothetical protein
VSGIGIGSNGRQEVCIRVRKQSLKYGN